MDFVKGIVGPLNSNALKDTARLVVLGSTVEAARRVGTSAWSSFVDSFFITATISQESYSYDWLMHWLMKQPAYSRSREFDVDSTTANGVTEVDDDEEGTEEVDGRRRRVITFLPSLDVTHSIYYRGHWLKITRAVKGSRYGSCAEIKISVVARNNNIIKTLVLEAKRMYEQDMEHRVHVFLAEGSSWRWNGAHQKRPLASVVLDPGVKSMLVDDARDFLASREWYSDRGIPFRRGYLLHGVPGSGKTSVIHAIAGELNLDIYVVSLSAKGMSDNTLTHLLGRVPSRSILLLEDLDAAFTKSVTRDANSTGTPATTATTTSTTTTVTTPVTPVTTVPLTPVEDTNTLSLSGLLNALDGVAASTGRLLFATTNHVERLDPALTRPGRLDVHVDFKYASKFQAEGIFQNFFPSRESTELAAEAEAEESEEASNTATPKRRRKVPRSTVPLLDEAEIAILAKQFAEGVPENEISVAGLQGYLLRNKTRPREAAANVGAWVVEERENKEKLKKRKEEEEAKARAEVIEKEAKEKVEKEAAEQKIKDAALATIKKEQEEKEAERRRLRRTKKRTDVVKAADSESDADAPAQLPTPATTPMTEANSQLEDSTTSASPASTSASDTNSSAATQTEESATSEAESDKSVEGYVVAKVEPEAEVVEAITVTASTTSATETA